MFCPNCKTEYRDGFTQCSDCGAALVESLGDAARDADDVPELFWAGNSPRLYQEFRAALKAAGVPFMDEPPVRYMYASVRPPLEIWTSKLDHDAALKVRQAVTGESDEELEGQESLEELNQEGGKAPNPYRDPTRPARKWGFFGRSKSEEPEAETPVEEAEDESGDGPGTDADARSSLLEDYFSSDASKLFSGEFYPEDATVNVYEGELDVAENLKACLREVGIPSALDAQGSEAGSAAKLRVLPEHEARAKEIVREVIEATPPE